MSRLMNKKFENFLWQIQMKNSLIARLNTLFEWLTHIHKAHKDTNTNTHTHALTHSISFYLSIYLWFCFSLFRSLNQLNMCSVSFLSHSCTNISFTFYVCLSLSLSICMCDKKKLCLSVPRWKLSRESCYEYSIRWNRSNFDIHRKFSAIQEFLIENPLGNISIDHYLYYETHTQTHFSFVRFRFRFNWAK